MRLNIMPSFLIGDSADHALRYSKVFGNGSLGHSVGKASYFGNILLIQFLASVVNEARLKIFTLCRPLKVIQNISVFVVVNVTSVLAMWPWSRERLKHNDMDCDKLLFPAFRLHSYHFIPIPALAYCQKFGLVGNFPSPFIERRSFWANSIPERFHPTKRGNFISFITRHWLPLFRFHSVNNEQKGIMCQ